MPSSFGANAAIAAVVAIVVAAIAYRKIAIIVLKYKRECVLRENHLFFLIARFVSACEYFKESHAAAKRLHCHV